MGKRKGDEVAGWVSSQPQRSQPASSSRPSQPSRGSWVGLDPDVVEMCDHFHIELLHTRRLNALMQTRGDKFEDDMLQLWAELEKASNPNAQLKTLMVQIEQGTFMGHGKEDPEMKHLMRKFRLDEQFAKAIQQNVGRHSLARRQAYYAELEPHLESVRKPSARAMKLLKKIAAGEELGSPSPDPQRRKRGMPRPLDKPDRRRTDMFGRPVEPEKPSASQYRFCGVGL